MRAALRRLAIAAATLALVSALVFVAVDGLADPALQDLGRAASPEALCVACHADIDPIGLELGYSPKNGITIGVPAFVAWYSQAGNLYA